MRVRVRGWVGVDLYSEGEEWVATGGAFWGAGGRGGGLGLTLRFSVSRPRMSISALMCAPTLRSDSAARKRLTEMRVMLLLAFRVARTMMMPMRGRVTSILTRCGARLGGGQIHTYLKQ